MEENTFQKKRCVVLNADVVGYTQLVADDPESTTKAMMEVRGIVETHVNQNAGILVDFVGDNLMAVFYTAIHSVQAAISMASGLDHFNRGRSDFQKIRLRMGIDLGDIIIADGKYYGDAVNIASRIQALACDGGLSISGRVYKDLDEPALRFRPIGQKRLKHIPEEETVYAFADLPKDKPPWRAHKSLSLELPTVAVLPMHTGEIDPATILNADIFRKELIHRLAGIPQLNLIDAQQKNTRGKNTAAARYMIETGIYKADKSILVYATLFDVTTMNIVKTYKWKMKDNAFFDSIDRCTDDVARSVEVELIVGEPAGLYAELNDPGAVEKIYLGWYHLRTDTRDGWEHALERFEEVRYAHPGQPYGYVLMAYAWLIGASNGWTEDSEDTLSKARQLAKSGYEAGDLTGMAQAVEASVLMSEGKHDEALAIVDRLEILRPTCDVTYGLEGSVRRYIGQWEKAIDLIDFAMHLTGVNKPWYPTVKSCSLFMGGRVEQAAVMAEMVLEHQSRNIEALLVLAASQFELGMARRAKATINKIQDGFPALDVVAWLDKNPYTSKPFVDRWKRDLESAMP